MTREFFTYILECGDGTLYTGQTAYLSKRILEHMAGKGGRYTRGRLPVKLCHAERHKTRGDAIRREQQIKKMSRKQKEELINEGRRR